MVLLIDLEVASSTLRLKVTLILDVINHVGSDLGTSESASLYLNFWTSHQMNSSLSKAELCLAEATIKANLIKHLYQVAIELLRNEYILAARAVVICLEPRLDARTIENLLALAALNCVLGHVDTNSTYEGVSEFALALNSIISGELIALCLRHHEVYNARLNLLVEA